MPAERTLLPGTAVGLDGLARCLVSDANYLNVARHVVGGDSFASSGVESRQDQTLPDTHNRPISRRTMRIALWGFGNFEREALTFSIDTPAGDSGSRYLVTDSIVHADFVVVNAESPQAVQHVAQLNRLADAIVIGHRAPDGVAAHLVRPIDPSGILRALDALIGNPSNSLGLDFDTSGLLPTLGESPRRPSQLGSPSMDSGELANCAPHRIARASARAACQRALAAVAASSANGKIGRDVLVVDSDEDARARLCELLVHFGFDPCAIGNPGYVEECIALRPYAAVFLDIELNDDGLHLVEKIFSTQRTMQNAAPAIFVMSLRDDHVMRVRAALAGIPAPLKKPLSRGAVVKALEECSVSLLRDQRRM